MFDKFEKQAIDQIEADRIELEVFESLLDADKQNYLKNREYFTIDYMQAWRTAIDMGGEIL